MKIRKRKLHHCKLCRKRIPNGSVCQKCAATMRREDDKLVATKATRRRLMVVAASMGLLKGGG